MSKIGEFITREREKQDISIRGLSKITGISHSEINKIESGDRATPSPYHLKALADALGITLITTERNDSSFGSAMCAGINAGFFKDFDDAKSKCLNVTGKTEPIAQNTEKYRKSYIRYKKISNFLMEIANEK